MKAIYFRKNLLYMLLIPCLSMQFPQTVRRQAPCNITETAFIEEETESEDIGSESEDTGYVYSFDVNTVYIAGDLSLELISVMIRADTWIEENSLENPGYTIDVYYHVRVKEKENNKSISYTLSDGRLIAEGREYALRDIIHSVEDEISGRNRTADPESGWRVFCRSFCLTEYGPDGKTELPDLLTDTPMELRITLTDCTNNAENLIELYFPAK